MPTNFTAFDDLVGVLILTSKLKLLYVLDIHCFKYKVADNIFIFLVLN